MGNIIIHAIQSVKERACNYIIIIVGLQSGEQHIPSPSLPPINRPSHQNGITFTHLGSSYFIHSNNIIIMFTIIIGSNPAQLPVDEPLRDYHLRDIYGQLREYSAEWKRSGCELGFREGELSNIEARPNNRTAEDSLRTMLSVWLQWAPRDGRHSTEYATLRALKRAVSNAGFGTTAEQLHISVATEANTHCASTEGDESAQPMPKKPRLK